MNNISQHPWDPSNVKNYGYHREACRGQLTCTKCGENNPDPTEKEGSNEKKYPKCRPSGLTQDRVKLIKRIGNITIKSTWGNISFREARKIVCCPGNPQMEIKRKRKERQGHRPCQRTEKAMGHEGDVDIAYNWFTLNNTERLEKETGRLKNRRTSGDHPDYSIIKICQYIDKSPKDLRRLAVTQTQGKVQQLKLMWKTRK